MRNRWLALAAALLMAAGAETAHGQGNCTVIQSGVQNTVNIGTPQEMTFVTFPVISCAGGRRISADNAYITPGSGVVRLMGNVQFQDTARTLRAATANYFSTNQRMSASGSVVLVHRGTNSTIRAEQVEYTEATAQRQSLVQAMGGRPQAIFREAGQQDSTILWAQQIDIVGENRLRGTGDARLERDSLVAQAYVIEFDQDVRRLELSGLRTQMDLPSYQLIGDSITVTLTAEDEIRDVFARHTASLDSEEFDVAAAAIRLLFENGGISRMVAMPWEPRAGGERHGPARVVNPQFNMTADSLDVLAPEQRLREAVAVGSAHVERITPDSLRPFLPEAEENVARMIANDWMRGDTVRAFFAAPVAAVLPAAEAPAVGEPRSQGPEGEPVLERLHATGQPAQAMHRMRQENAPPDSRFAIAYLVGRNVEITFIGGVVDVVSASEDVRGVYLQPSEAARRSGNTPAGRGGGQ
jgi:lipopolysaccharide export system protein LptA